MKVGNLLDGVHRRIDNIEHEIYRYRTFSHAREDINTTIFQTAATLALGSLTVGAEAMNLHLSHQEDTIQNNLMRASCKAVVLGAGYLTTQAVGELF
jgi:hypothetical protein